MSVSCLNIAVIGLGWVATARHLPVLLRHPVCKIVGVVDRDAAKAAAVARRFGIQHHCGAADVAAVPWLDEVDAITIGAPPMSHHDLACAALQRGKHVLTEKPFAMTVAEGQSMLLAATNARRTLAVVHNFQFARAMVRLQSDYAAGRLGTIKWIAAKQLGNPRRRLPSWYKTLPLGLFYDESPHFYYLLRQLAGDLKLDDAVARGRAAGDKTPQEIRLLYRGNNDLPVSIDCNFNSPLSEWVIMVGGSEALGVVDIFRDFYLRLPQDGAHGLPQILRTSAWATWQHWGQYIPNGIDFLRGRLDYGNDVVMQRFIASVQNGSALQSISAPQNISAPDAQAVLSLQHEAITQIRWL